MKLPPELDELMWQIAEQGDAKAFDEFQDRYPEYMPEMLKRSSMVRGLKGSRPAHALRKRDRFMPSRQVKQNPVPNWALALVAAGLIAGGSFATYGIIRFNDSQKAVNQPVAQTNQDTQQPLTNFQQNPPPVKNQNPTPPVNEQNAPPEIVLPFDTLVTVINSRITLEEALFSIASQAGVKLEVAPGFPELDISIDYREAPAMEVLRDMGRNFGFSVFKQTETVALLVPARDETNPQDPLPLAGRSGRANDDSAQNGPLLELPH